MAWTDQMVEDLKKMWKEGYTTGEIGKKLGVTKNSIVGKVHRLGLSGRPSPIKKKPETSHSSPSKTTSPATKPAEKKPAPTAHSASDTPAPKAQPAPQAAPATKAQPHTEPSSTTHNQFTPSVKEKNDFFFTPKIDVPHHISPSGYTSLTSLDNHTCRWPIGDPKDENFHFCGKKVRLGQTYCEEHAALAYVKPNTKK